MSEEIFEPSGDDAAVDPRNSLNDLTGRDWIKSTKSWFICDSRRYWKNKQTELHPARYPEEMVLEFVRFFTKRGQWVLDPFLGSGATLVACAEEGRNAVGVEINPKYAEISANRLSQASLFTETFVVTGDSRQVGDQSFWRERVPAGMGATADGLPQFDYVITSPPYWSMLRTSRGGASQRRRRGPRAAWILTTRMMSSTWATYMTTTSSSRLWGASSMACRCCSDPGST